MRGALRCGHAGFYATAFTDETGPNDVAAFTERAIRSVMSASASIRVLLFAQASEAFGRSELVLDATTPVSVREVRDRLGREAPGAARLLESCAFAVNESYATADGLVKPGDTIAIIPPVSGG